MYKRQIREWLVAEGTMVEAGEPVLIIETDKVETEVEARESGILTITGKVGENYECGAVIGQLLEAGETSTASVETASPAAEPSSPPVATAPAPSATPAPAPVAATPTAPAAVASAGVAIAVRGEHDRILASPMARAAARDAGVDLAQVAGTGPDGRIVAEDVAAYVASPPTPAASVAPAPTAAAAPAVAPTPHAAAPIATGVSATGGARMLAELLGIDLRSVPALSLIHI